MQLKKHDLYQDPPKKPFFKSNSKAHKLDDKSSDGLSPGKRIQYRSECINQLDKWHGLMERGAITEEEFKEMQQTILTDIKKFYKTSHVFNAQTVHNNYHNQFFSFHFLQFDTM